MQDLLGSLSDVVIAVFAVTSMLSVGLRGSVREIVGQLGRPRVVARALLANFVLVPALALLVLWLIPLDASYTNGLLLISVAAGAPFLIKLSEAAGADLGLTATLLVLLLPATIVYMPLVVPLLLPGAEVSILVIATPLLLTMLLPLLVGLLIRRRRKTVARRLHPVSQTTSTVALVVVLLLVFAQYDAIIAVDWKTPLAALIIILGAFCIGYLFGGRNPDRREVLGLGTAQRNIAAASVVASQGLNDPDAVITVVGASVIGLAVLFPIARVLWRRERKRHAQARRETG